MSQTTGKALKNKRSLSSDRDEKRSENGNFSVISLLNGSFFTMKSGKSSRKDSVNGGECFCKYRERYTHYKCESISFKNQL